MNEHANHECCCVVELKRNELSLLDDANHARNTDAADVAGGVRRGDWADGLTACEPARRGRQLRSFVRLEIPALQYLTKARGTQASRS